MFIRSEFNYDADQASLESGLECLDESKAIQSQAEEADINTIVRRFGLTGTLPAGLRPPTYEDFEDVFDFQSAMNAVKEATDRFMLIPAAIRARFANDPQLFVEFASNPENIEELREMGLAPKAEVVDTPVVDKLAPKAKVVDTPVVDKQE